MSKSKAAGRQLQILDSHESLQLDLLSFVSDYALADLSVKEKQSRTTLSRSNIAKASAQTFHGHVDKNKTFTSFCMGDSNQFAVEAVKRFIQSERSDYGLIFLKAQSGLGKTHILHAAANELLLKKKSFYLSSPLTMSALIDSFNVLKFYDTLLIDDIEEIEKNSDLQKVFCQLFDYAQAGKMNIILTGTKLPKELSGCDERFKGKLSAALILHISGLNNSLSYEIVQMKARAINLELPQNVKELVASQLEFNVYGIESSLHKLKNTSELSGSPVTIEMARQEIQVKEKTLNHSARPLLVDVANAFNLSVDNLLSSIRRKDFALARHAAMFILREKEKMNVMRIAELFGKDHSSVIYGVEKIRSELERDQQLKKIIEQIISSYA
jgi:chromosomal replication initiator protein